jgi:uncharacterized protein YndB with AHSA1/START domain
MNRLGSHHTSYPSAREIVHVRSFDAPIELVYAALTDPAHIVHWGATGGDRMTTCEIDLRAGGAYRWAFVTPDGIECSFRGSYLELEAPHKIVSTWLFEGWPDAPAVSSETLEEVDGVTTLTSHMTFDSEAGAANMLRAHQRAQENGNDNGQGASFDALEILLDSLLSERPSN